MRRSPLPALLRAALAVLVTPVSYAHAQNWPSFRGPEASGVASGTPPELLSTNRMGEIVMATPAISGTLLIVRTHTQLVGLRQS